MTPDPSEASLLERAVRIQAIAADITALEDPTLIPQRVVEALVRELNLAVASVVLKDPDTGTLRYAADIGVPPEIKALGFRPGGTADTVLRTGEAVFIENPEDPRVNPEARPHFKAWACLPIRHRERTYGLLFVNMATSHVFPPIERHILATFASQTAIALDNARLHQAERQRASALAALAALGRDLSSTLEWPELVRILGRALREHLTRAPVQALWVQEGDVLVPAWLSGLGSPKREPSPLEPTQSHLLAHLDRRPGPRSVPVEALEADLGPLGVGLPRPCRVTAVALRASDQPQGLLALTLPEGQEDWTDPELDFLQALADRGALALHNAALYTQSQQEAQRDSLTKVLNHGAIEARITDALTEAWAQGTSLALLMLDADHFKACNDRHGHAFGDRVLVALARTVRDQVRPTDLVGRWGGEEFVVLLPNVDGRLALRIAERIRMAAEALVLPLPCGTPTAAPTLSIGVATFPGSAKTLTDLVEAADAALYQAKARGRNQVCVAPSLTLPGR